MTQYELEELKTMADEQGNWAIRLVNETEYWVPEALSEISQTDLVGIQSEYANRIVELEKRHTPKEAERILWDEIIQKVKKDSRCLSDNDALNMWSLRMDGAPIGEILQNVVERRELAAYEALIEDKIRCGRNLRDDEMEYVMGLDEDDPLRKLMSEKEQENRNDEVWGHLCTPMGYYELMVDEAKIPSKDCRWLIESKKRAAWRAMDITEPKPGTSVSVFIKAKKRYKEKMNAVKREYEFWKQVQEIHNRIESLRGMVADIKLSDGLFATDYLKNVPIPQKAEAAEAILVCHRMGYPMTRAEIEKRALVINNKRKKILYLENTEESIEKM